MTFDVSTVRVVDKMGLNARQAVFQTVAAHLESLI
jgi:hypothetical protein